MGNYERLMEYALKLIAMKRYTVKEMQDKLMVKVKKWRHKFSENDAWAERLRDGTEFEVLQEELVMRIMDRLFELKYLDDEKYARDYVSEKIKLRPRGKFLLSRELKAKGVDSKIIDEVLCSEDIDEFGIAINLIEKRHNRWSKFSKFQQKTKAYQFLSSRGIDKDAIYRVLNSWYN